VQQADFAAEQMVDFSKIRPSRLLHVVNHLMGMDMQVDLMGSSLQIQLCVLKRRLLVAEPLRGYCCIVFLFLIGIKASHIIFLFTILMFILEIWV